MSWLDEHMIDATAVCGGVSRRPLRKRTLWLVAHRINTSRGSGPLERRGVTLPDEVAGIVRFWLEDPEGVATTTLAGSYRSKLPTIERWRREGIPDENRARAFVPYNVIVARDGTPFLCLPLEAVGAHAVGANGNGIGVAFVGDFRSSTELTPAESRAGRGGDTFTAAQVTAADRVFRDLLVLFPEAEPTTHDEVKRRSGEEPKGCPGHYAARELFRAFAWAKGAAQIIAQGAERR